VLAPALSAYQPSDSLRPLPPLIERHDLLHIHLLSHFCPGLSTDASRSETRAPSLCLVPSPSTATGAKLPARPLSISPPVHTLSYSHMPKCPPACSPHPSARTWTSRRTMIPKCMCPLSPPRPNHRGRTTPTSSPSYDIALRLQFDEQFISGGVGSGSGASTAASANTNATSVSARPVQTPFRRTKDGRLASAQRR